MQGVADAYLQPSLPKTSAEAIGRVSSAVGELQQKTIGLAAVAPLHYGGTFGAIAAGHWLILKLFAGGHTGHSKRENEK